MMNKKITGSSILSYLAQCSIITLVYYIAGKFGLSLAFVHASATAIWPPTGIALAVILLLGYRFWPSILLGAFLVNLSTEGTIFTSLGIASGNTLEALWSAFIMNKWTNGPKTFNRPLDVLKFSILIGFFSTTVSATVGVISLCLGGFANWAQFGPIWLTWWLGDTAGAFIVAPLIILWSLNRRLNWNYRKCFEAFVLLLSLFFITQIVFDGWFFSQNQNYPLAFLCFPFLMWAAFRFGQRGAITNIFILSAAAIFGTLHGHGPFGNFPPKTALLLLQAFMGLMAVTCLIVSSEVQERERIKEQLRRSKEDLSDLLENATEGLHWVGPDGKILWANQAQLDMLGYSPEEYIGRPVSEFHVEPSVAEDIMKRNFNNEKLFNYEARLRCKNGSMKFVVINSSVLWERGQFIRTHCFIRDITERKMTERCLEKLKEQLEIEKEKLEQVVNIEEGLNTILDVNKLVDFILNRTTEILAAERCSLMLFDKNSQELCVKGYKGIDAEVIGHLRIKMGDSIAGLIAEEGNPVLVKNIEEDSRFARKNRDSYKTKSFMCAPIRMDHTLTGMMCVADKKDDNGEGFSLLDFNIFCMIARQVAVALENAHLYRELNYLAVTDPLTDLNNFRHFTRCLDNEINRVRRYSDPLCLLMIDVDNFKRINDQYGHQEGDLLLQKVGEVLKKTTRQVDIVCRYAGDEFAVILPQTEVSQAHKVAEKIKKTIENLPDKRKMSVSVGLAQYHESMTRYDFIVKADTALLEAKKRGKNRVHSFI